MAEAQAQEQQAAEDEAVKKKETKDSGPNQKLVLGVLVLNAVVLAGLAGVVWMSYTKSSTQVTLGDVAASKEKPAKKEEKGGEHGGKEGEKKGEEASNFVKQSFTVPLADSRGSHFVKFDVEMEVEDDFVKEELNRLTPKVRDFIIVVVSSKSYEQVESIEGRDFLREEIRNKVNGYLTKGQVKNIYFTQFIIQ